MFGAKGLRGWDVGAWEEAEGWRCFGAFQSESFEDPQ